MFLRTLIDAAPRNFGYTIIEYNLVTGSFKTEEIKVGDTRMRIEQGGQQYEVHSRNGWQLCSKTEFDKYFETFLAIRKVRGYTGDIPRRPSDYIITP